MTDCSVEMSAVERRATSVKIPKNVRNKYDASFKLKVIQHAESTSNREAAREFGMDESCIRRWRIDKDKLKKTNPKRCAFSGPKSGRFSNVENSVCEYVRDLRKNGLPVSREVLYMKALTTATEMNIPRSLFKASRGWINRVMKRNGFSLRRRTSLAQKLPTDFADKLVEYQRYVISLRRKNNYLLGQIGNADETAVYFDMPQSTTIADKGSRSVIIKSTGNEKLRVTVMLAVLADGRKLPPFVILKRKGLPKENLPAGIHFRCQENGWMSNELMLDWLQTVWGRRPGALLNTKNMLILDSFRGHTTDDVKNKLKSMHSDMVTIPGGMTSQLQVLDVCVNKPFKDHLRCLYSEWLISGNCPLTPAGKIKKPSVGQLGQWIKTAWDRISTESIVKGFKKCCVTNSLDGTEDDVLWEDCSSHASSSDDENSDPDL